MKQKQEVLEPDAEARLQMFSVSRRSVRDGWMGGGGRGRPEINSMEEGKKGQERRRRADASAERVALVVVLQLVLGLPAQLPVAKPPVHCAIPTHVNDVLVFVIVFLNADVH